MTRKTLVFGNGLGMALDQEYFKLPSAINYIWKHGNILSDTERQYIQKCLPGVDDRPPEGEHELDILHLAVSASGFLKYLSGGDVEWLSSDGRKFPDTIAKFVHKVATRLHKYDGGELPETFVNPLCEFLKKSNSHVATLNYDRLLYDAMIDNKVLEGYKHLVDGMWETGFDRSNLERHRGKNFGYYLHLHGSPLFINNSETPIKKRRHELSLDSEFIGRHLVLTHMKHKLSVISSSLVLSAYWDYLGHALSESEEIIVFGCSGEDEHLNQKLKPYSSVPTRVVEWIGAGDENERAQF